MEGVSSNFEIEEQIWWGSFGCSIRISKIVDGKFVDIPAQKIEDVTGLFDLSAPNIQGTLYSIFGAKDRRTPTIFNHRSSAPKIEEPLPSSIFGIEEGIEDRTQDGSGAIPFNVESYSKLRGGSSIFRLRRTKTRSSIFGAERTKPPSPFVYFLDPMIEDPLLFFSHPSLDQWPPASLSHTVIWIFSPIFYLGNRCENEYVEDRYRSSDRFKRK